MSQQTKKLALAKVKVKSPYSLVTIKWEVDGASGSTECEAWRGQSEIDGLQRAGYKVLSINAKAVEL